jgi:hypothetical protein
MPAVKEVVSLLHYVNTKPDSVKQSLGGTGLYAHGCLDEAFQLLNNSVDLGTFGKL